MRIESVHEGYVKSRRLEVLADHFAKLFPEGASILDVGSGDGGLAAAVVDRKRSLRFRGIDTLVRSETHIPVAAFDGTTIPHDDNEYDYVLFSDVLHHTIDPMILLREAVRVASRGIVIKDHLVQGFLAKPTLQFMDRVGNQRFGVDLPHNYWRPIQWDTAFKELDLRKEEYRTRIGLYPYWANWFFGRGLHFIARLGFPDNGSRSAE